MVVAQQRQDENEKSRSSDFTGPGLVLSANLDVALYGQGMRVSFDGSNTPMICCFFISQFY
jgi:hypothetical protein